MKKNPHLPAFLGTLVFLCAFAVLAGSDDEANREMLSTHETIAEFQGIDYRLCRGRTAACPERCGDSGEFATFRIVKYLNYNKPGEYGDPKQETYQIQVSDFDRNPIDEKLASRIRKLEKGDRILLSWRHDYVTTKGGSKFPDRVVTKLQRTEKE